MRRRAAFVELLALWVHPGRSKSGWERTGNPSNANHAAGANQLAKGHTPVTAKKKSGESPKTDRPLGECVRKLRESQQLSVRTLASKCGFSASFISQIELGQASPSLASLERLAAALGVTLGEFFQTASPPGPAIVRAAERQALHSEWSHAKIETLGAIHPGSRLEAILVTLRSGGASGSRVHTHETELLAVVFDGEVLLTLDDAVHALERGDAVTIPAGTRHRWQNKSGKSAQILKVNPRMNF